MKKIIRRKNTHTTSAAHNISNGVWRVLIVDDEPDVHAITRLALSGFEFEGKTLEILQAYSAAEAQPILEQHSDIAMAMIDIVMETDDAGLQLVEFIRNTLKNQLIRLVIRTGQPGIKPEKEIINHYDIDDYKEKNDLTETKIYTSLRLALKSYQTLCTLQNNRDALHKILEIAPELYHPQSIKRFFEGVLNQIIGLCHLGDSSLISSVKNGFLASIDTQSGLIVHAGTGAFAKEHWNDNAEEIAKICLEHYQKNKQHSTIYRGDPLPAHAALILLHLNDDKSDQSPGFIYLENTQNLQKTDQELISIMAYQCASALKNLQLYFELEDAHQQTSQLLTMAEQARDMAEAANSAKTRFLAKISHELRTPLNAIIGYSALIKEEAHYAGYGEVLPDLEKIQMAGQHLLGMISDILDITKIETEQLSLELGQFDIAQLLSSLEVLLQPLLLKKENRLNIKFFDEIKFICTDQSKIQQILLNLLNNANKFTQAGDIHLNVRLKQKQQSQYNTKQCKANDKQCQGCIHSNEIEFEVTDTGLGIPQEYLDKIFDVFHQVDDSSGVADGTTHGAGLGLSISRQLAQVMNGSLSASSKGLNQGASFYLRVPVNMLAYQTTTI